MKSMVVLRVGLGITFFWIGILIFQNPDQWTGFLSDWFIRLLPISPAVFMQLNSIMDILLGVLLVFGILTPWVSLVSTLELAGILIASGINEVTIRDVGLLSASAALFLEHMPDQFKRR